MLPRARHEYLLRQLELHGSIVAADIAQALGVAQVTIRRDVAKLDAAGMLARVHGGALEVRKASSRPAPSKTLVGVVVPSATAYYPEIIRGMETAAASCRLRLALGISHYQPELERSRVQRLLDLGVKGLIVTPTITPERAIDVAHWLESLPVPVVVLERRTDQTPRVRQLDNARTDHVYGTVLAAEHLAGLGHSRIGLALFDRTPTAGWLHVGYDNAVARLDLEPAPIVSLPKGEDDPAALASVFERFLEECSTSGVRAALVHTDFHAARLVEVAHIHGLRVPEDLAIVAYDDELAEHADVPLSAITSPRRELGREALRLLADRINLPAHEHPPYQVQLLPRLTIRESCGARPSGLP